MVLWNADPGIAGLVTYTCVLANLIQHALIENGVLASHALLQFTAPANCHIHEGVKFHGVLLGNGLSSGGRGHMAVTQSPGKCIVSRPGMPYACIPGIDTR